MEKLKCVVPERLKRRVEESHIDDLPSLSSSLLQLFLSLPQFHQLISELAAEPSTQAGLCGKNEGAALDLKQKGNQCYSSGDHSQALRCYSQALRLAPIDAHHTGKNLVATLYLNRASLFHKMGLPMESLRDCSRALEISPCYPKVWYRRGKVNATLGNYEDSVHDLSVAKDMEPSIGGKKQIERELDMLARHHEKTIAKPASQKSVEIPDVPSEIKLQCVKTPDKGRGMVSQFDIPQASLIHAEEPYAVVILKHCRETHCHYCLNELPADTIPCISCSLPLYCSQHCQVQAGGPIHIPDTMVGSNFKPTLECIPEHKHECQGVHWPAILPSDVVLAGRVVVKTMEQKGQFTDVPNLSETFIVILLSQIRVNSIAVVRMRSNTNDSYDQQDWFQNFSFGEAGAASSVEQVRVGQALYKAASLFNHSCLPNIHAYFMSRTLLLRTTEFVSGGCALELSYGPQVGQWDCKDRLRFLEEEYFFRCWCCGCSEVNESDLVISGFCCVNPNCSGVVLDNLVANCEKHKPKVPETISNKSHLQVHELKDIDIKKVAQISLDQTQSSFHVDSGYCLKCGSYCNFASRSKEVRKAWTDFRRYTRSTYVLPIACSLLDRLQDSIASKDTCSTNLPDALRSLGLLRSILHAYNKGIAEAEDILAKAFCFIGDFEPARDHCKASIEILEKLYGPNHIAIGYELAKLASIQLALGDCTAVYNINRLSAIFSTYYGPHAGIIFPYLLVLERERSRIIQ
ncbi:hypothetical protein Gotri_000258 [Gossypium trilobum]|uniref:SET domain-containing protein n=1 Tax=Gossypium trilobum TaxID=34281 RepID=A0A7J9FAN9_9ROSI|nr:hypothetical protein [Gossypium trilobum]